MAHLDWDAVKSFAELFLLFLPGCVVLLLAAHYQRVTRARGRVPSETEGLVLGALIVLAVLLFAFAYMGFMFLSVRNSDI